ncbi:MAG: Minf_1886 family protein [Candidatus Latescibacterota bacterium]
MKNGELVEKVEHLAERDGRYRKEAYLFIYDALQFTVEKLGKSHLSDEQRHISGRDLLGGISEFGLNQFGPLTRSVFAHWGVHTTRDFGQIVFNLVGANLMRKTDRDCIEDFTDVYDFEREFDWSQRRAQFRRPAGAAPAKE